MGRNKKQKKSHHGKTGDGPSQAEIWDDSALIRSWNDAVAEYEYYHSLHARGEDVDEVLARAEAEEDGEVSDSDEDPAQAGEWRAVIPPAAGESASATAARSSPLEDGEMEDGEVDVEAGEPAAEGAQKHATAPIGPVYPSTATANASNVAGIAAGAGASPLVQQAPSANTDQTLENIKMAYYWAGYYSGLYDGQRQAQAEAQSEQQAATTRESGG